MMGFHREDLTQGEAPSPRWKANKVAEAEGLFWAQIWNAEKSNTFPLSPMLVEEWPRPLPSDVIVVVLVVWAAGEEEEWEMGKGSPFLPVMLYL